MNPKTWHLKSATARELADLYEVSYHIFKTHIREFAHLIGKRIGNSYSPKQVIIIIENYGPFPNTEIIYPGQH